MFNGRAFIRGRGKAKSFPASLETGKSLPPLEGKWFHHLKQRLFTHNSPPSPILWGRENTKTFTGEGETLSKQKGKRISLSLEEKNGYFGKLNLFPTETQCQQYLSCYWLDLWTKSLFLWTKSFFWRNHHTNSILAQSQLFLTQFWPNFKSRFLGTSRTNSSCPGDATT